MDRVMDCIYSWTIYINLLTYKIMDTKIYKERFRQKRIWRLVLFKVSVRTMYRELNRSHKFVCLSYSNEFPIFPDQLVRVVYSVASHLQVS